MSHPALVPGGVAVITGGASGIGLAAAKKLAGMEMRIVIADRGGERLEAARKEIGGEVLAHECDVSKRDQLQTLNALVLDRFGGTDVLMNNAGISPATNITGPLADWQALLDVNLWGVIHGTQVFLPDMLRRGRPGLVINTGSKQGITTPPGDTIGAWMP